MSDGRILESSAHDPILERFQKTIAVFDSLRVEVQQIANDQKKLRDEMQIMRDLHDDFVSKVKNDYSELRKLFSSSETKLLDLEDHKRFANLEISNLRDSIKDLRDLQHLISKKISPIERSISDLKSLEITGSAIKDLKNDLDELKKSLIQEIDICKRNLYTYIEETKDAASCIEDLKQSREKQEKSAKDIRDECRNLSSSFENFKNSLDQEIRNAEARIKEKVEDITGKIKIPEMARFTTKDDLEKLLSSFKSTLELASLDAKNAFLKSSNSATQIELLTKKIENIQLLLKKYELDKG